MGIEMVKTTLKLAIMILLEGLVKRILLKVFFRKYYLKNWSFKIILILRVFPTMKLGNSN